MTTSSNAAKPGRRRFGVDLEDLETFLAVAEAESFSRAAEHLNLSQPSVSNRVRRLEEKLGVRLLDRTTRRVGLTAPGQRLNSEASDLLRGLRNLLEEFNLEASSRRRQVTVAATLTVATIGLPPILRRFHDEHPSITVVLRDQLSPEAVQMVLDGRCDLAVMAQPEMRSGISFDPLISDPCVVLTSLGHRLLRHRAAPIAEVLENLVLSPNGHVGLRQAIRLEAEKRNLTLRLAPEAEGVGNAMTLIAMAAAGFGVCIHPRSFVPAELEPTLGMVPFSDCEIIRTFGIITADDRPLSHAAREFRDFLRAPDRGATGLAPNRQAPASSLVAGRAGWRDHG